VNNIEEKITKLEWEFMQAAELPDGATVMLLELIELKIQKALLDNNKRFFGRK